MQIHTIIYRQTRKKGKRVGRGGKRGTYSGRGIKGQKARAGRKIRPELRDVIKRIPKKRGYKEKRFRVKPAVVNVSLLNKFFQSQEEVSPLRLVEKGLVSRYAGRIPEVKILGNGDIKHSLVVKGCILSQTAEQKIIKAGGQIEPKK